MDVSRQTLLTAASLAEQADFRIGSVTVYPSIRIVAAGDRREKVEPRVMQVLIALAQAANEVLTRDELFERCWGGVFVGDDSLNRAVAGVRRIASHLADDSFTIETIPRTGYRLVSEHGPQMLEDDAVAVDDPIPLASSGGISRRWLVAGGAAVGLGAALVFWTRGGPVDPAQRLIDEARIVMRAGSPDAMNRAIGLLRQAVAKYPESGPAWGLLSLALARVDEHALDTATISVEEVERSANRALQLESGNADAMAALAISIPYYGDWLATEQRFDQILAKHPDHIFTQDSRLFFLGAVGRMKESAEDRFDLVKRAPFDAAVGYKEVYAHWFMGDIAKADRAAMRGLDMWPRDPGFWFARLWVLANTGRIDRALAHVSDQATRPAFPPPMFDTMRLALEAAQSRQPAAIAAATQRVMMSVGQNVSAVINAMMLLNIMGAIDDAFALADAYYLERGPIIAAMQWRPGQPVVPDQRRRKTNMLFVPSMRAMQQDPRFMPLMEDIGLAAYWDKRGIAPDFLAGPSG